MSILTPGSPEWLTSREASGKLVDQIHETRLHTLESLRTYGQNTIKGLFLLNGGAPLALLTFVGSLYGKADQSSLWLASRLILTISGALLAFAIGLVLSTLASGISYINYVLLTHSNWEPFEAHDWLQSGKIPASRTRSAYWTTVTMWSAIFVCACSAAAFIVGGWEVFQALRVRPRSQERAILRSRIMREAA